MDTARFHPINTVIERIPNSLQGLERGENVMKRVVCILLMSIFLCACAAAETGEKLTAEYFVQAANAEYPEWMVWNSERFARGTVNSGFGEHITLSLYRISNGYIEAL